MNHQNESVALTQVVDSEAFILESVRIFFDSLWPSPKSEYQMKS
jgi:hypothetical protein